MHLLWTTQWRADQKNVADRDKAAALGIAAFGRESSGFRQNGGAGVIKGVASLPLDMASALAAAMGAAKGAR